MNHHSSKMTICHLAWPFLISFVALMEAKGAHLSSLQKLKKGIYEEDLAPYRIEFCKRSKAPSKEPKAPLKAPLDQTQRLEELLAKRKAAYEGANCLKGYTIQVYMGDSRTAALKAQDLASTFAYPPRFHYRQPHYTVQLGFFSNRLEAYFVYLTLVKKLPSAMIRPCMFTRQAYLAYIAATQNLQKSLSG